MRFKERSFKKLMKKIAKKLKIIKVKIQKNLISMITYGKGKKIHIKKHQTCDSDLKKFCKTIFTDVLFLCPARSML